MAPGAGNWSRIQERGSIWGLRFTLGCVRRFGNAVSLPLILLVVGYFFLTDRQGRQASRSYLERVHARTDPRPSWQPGLWQSFLHYREFALSIADRVALWGGRGADFEFAFHGREYFKPHVEQGKGAILLGAHLGSFDALRVISVKDGVTVNVVMYTRHAPKINEVFEAISPEIAIRVIPVESGSAQTILQIKACIDRGELVAILADRVEPGDQGRVCDVDFLGAPTRLPAAPFQLPLILGCQALMVLGLRAGSGRYEVHAEPLVEPGERLAGAARAARTLELATLYSERLEHYCTLAPRQWFNFYPYWAQGNRA